MSGARTGRGTTVGHNFDDEKPSLALTAVMAGMRVYSAVFAQSPAAGLLSVQRPVRRTGFDLDLMVEEIRREAEDVLSFTFVRPAGGVLPAWIPGCHLDIFLPSGLQRQYSLTGSPDDRERYRIAVRRIAANQGGGGGSLEMHTLISEGDILPVRGPRNAYPFIGAESYLFVAGGIGITPILPMVKAAAAKGADAKFIYLGRSEATMPFLDELRRIKGVTIEIRPDDTHGFPDVKELLSNAEPGAAVYLCGPTPMLEAARKAMPEINPKGSLHIERFSAPPVAGGAPFTLKLARSNQTIQVGADETALAAMRRELPAVRYSCQQGYCGTCKVAVLAGKVDHRDSALLERERADNMMICVSRAAGDEVTIDL